MNNSINKLYEDRTIDRYIRNNPRRNAKCSPLLWGDNYNFQENFTNLNNNQTINKNKINAHLIKKNKKQIRNNDTNEDNYYYLDNKNKLYNVQMGNEKYNKTCNDKNIKNTNNIKNNVRVNNINNNNNFIMNFKERDNNKMVFKKKQDMTLLKMIDIDSKLLMKKNIIGDRNEVNNIHNRIDEMNYDILEKDIKNNALKRVGRENNLNPSMVNISMKSNLDDDFFTSKVNKDYFMPANRLCRGKNDLEKYFTPLNI